MFTRMRKSRKSNQKKRPSSDPLRDVIYNNIENASSNLSKSNSKKSTSDPLINRIIRNNFHDSALKELAERHKAKSFENNDNININKTEERPKTPVQILYVLHGNSTERLEEQSRNQELMRLFRESDSLPETYKLFGTGSSEPSFSSSCYSTREISTYTGDDDDVFQTSRDIGTCTSEDNMLPVVINEISNVDGDANNSTESCTLLSYEHEFDRKGADSQHFRNTSTDTQNNVRSLGKRIRRALLNILPNKCVSGINDDK